MKGLLYCLLFCLIAPWPPASRASAPETLSRDRQQYGEAMEAIDRGNWTEYRQLRPALDEYPLAIYLDYSELTRQPGSVRPADARRFISLSADSPLPNRFLSVYLERAGRERRWDDFLQVKPDEPNSIELKCYYFRAQLARGNKELAWQGAERLWVHGTSRPDECDPLFDAWLSSGQLRDELVWARLLQAFDNRQRSLMSYVARKGSEQLKPWSDKLLAIYRRPDQLRRQSLPPEQDHSVDIIVHGLPYLARYKVEQALADWQYFESRYAFDQAQRHTIEYAITLRSLFARSPQNLAWVEAALERLGDDKLVEIRLRWALEEGEWTAIEANLAKLSSERRQEPVWRYWSARAHQVAGREEEYRLGMEALAAERGYYGFLAADRLQRPYAFRHQPLVLQAAASDPLRQLPAVRRIEELQFHDESNLAYSEWFKVLNDTIDPGRHQQLAVLASEQGWHRMAIDAANRAKAWDLLDLRFPMPYQETFQQYAQVRQVPSTELMAIARRESAFHPQARSPVGARGLMQIMPATGAQVASRLGQRYTSTDLYEVDHNVLLGSAYYRQLLDRYQGNRILALAAYNAGPHRVDRWRNRKDQEALEAERWVETIPFRETRDYVQAVLSYNVVFQYLQGGNGSLLTSSEREARY